MKLIFIIFYIALLSSSVARRLFKRERPITLILGDLIGKGAHGKVYALTPSHHGDFVVKIVEFSDGQNPTEDTSNVASLSVEHKKKNCSSTKLSRAEDGAAIQNRKFENKKFKKSVASFIQEVKILQHLTGFELKGTVSQVVDKVTPIQFTFDEEDLKRFKCVKNKPVTSLLYTYLDVSRGFIVMPRYIDLFDEYAENFEKISSESYYSLFVEIAKLIQYQHENNVLIRDLRLENMLLRKPLEGRLDAVLKGQEPWGIVLADFGSSCLIDNSDQSKACLKRVAGSEDFASPEQKNNLTTTTFKSDIFSLARVIISAVHPGLTQITDHTKVEQNHNSVRTYLKGTKTRFVPEMKQLLLRMHDKSPDERPSIEQFLTEFKQIGIKLKNQIITP